MLITDGRNKSFSSIQLKTTKRWQINGRATRRAKFRKTRNTFDISNRLAFQLILLQRKILPR